MNSTTRLFAGALLFPLMTAAVTAEERTVEDFSPPATEQQLPLRMHSKMERRPTVRVGVDSGDMLGRDHRVLQAAVDYIAALGGGTVEIGPGEYLMQDSLHLRSNVIVRGVRGETVLRKADSVLSRLAIDGDYGEQQFTVRDAEGFSVGQGVAIWDDNAHGFHTTVARIIGQSGNTFAIDKPLMADCLVSQNAQAATVFPVISGYDLQGVELHDLTIEGNRQGNAHLNGCRGGGIFLYRAFGTVIDHCTVRNYNGDGISFQQSNDVVVTNCISEKNAELGLHPGSGSQRPTVRHSIARHNGTDGLFLCWRVRHGLFEHNVLEDNGRFGISIGHKDTDNLLQHNLVRQNHSNGVFFRDESLGMAAHRNTLVENIIEDNGRKPGTAAIRVRGATNGLRFERNTVRDTRSGDRQTQTTGVLLEEQVGDVELEENTIEAPEPLVDRRAAR